MEWWQLGILVIIFGFVSMIEICVIIASVNKMLNAKMKAKAKIEMIIFKQYMQELKLYLDEITDMFIGKIMNAMEPGYKAPKIKPVKLQPTTKAEEDIDPMDDWDSLFK